MLDNYIENQPVAYKIIKNLVKKDRISHAFIIETNDNSIGFDFAMSFAKFLMCPYNKSNNDKCDNCYQCKRIDEMNFPEFKILNSPNMQIKKEEINNLQKEFSVKPIESKYKVYIINQAEKLNDSSSAALLKFLEEPEESIIAILLTNNKNLILNTIQSRCQTISLKSGQAKSINILEELADLLYISSDDRENFVTNEENISKFDSIKKFIIHLNNKDKDTLAFKSELFDKYFKTKEDYLFAFNAMIVIYKKNIENKINNKQEDINIIKEKTLSNMSNQLRLIMTYKDKIKNNLNLNLMLDKFIMDVEELM